MIELDGVEYPVKSPAENAGDMATYINTYCTNHNITNTEGDVIQITANMSNPLYLVLFGLGYLVSVLQKLIYNAGCTFSIPASSSKQLLNLASLAGVKRHASTKTTIQATIFANVAGDGAVSCEITTALTATITVGGTTVVFHPAFDITIPINGVQVVILVAEQEGSFNITADTITGFDSAVAGLRAMTTLASIPGLAQESIADLRLRIQNRSVQGTQVDLAASAIQALDGVSRCTIYFNISATENVVVGDSTTGVVGDAITVGPRQALIMLQGYSSQVAELFYSRLFCQTAGSAEYQAIIDAQTSGTTVNRTIIKQVYTTQSGQQLPVYIASPRILPIYIRLYINSDVSYTDGLNIKDTVATLTDSLTIGQTVSASDVTKVVQEAYPTLALQGVTVSVDNVNFTYKAVPASDVLFSFNIANITIQQA